DWKEATELVTEMNRRQFPAVSPQQWSAFAHAVFNDDNGLPAPAFDPNLAQAISMMDGPMPELWPQFAALTHVPLMGIRGENSDILSDRTFSLMRSRHPRMTAVTVRGQGHAPLLMDTPTIGAVAEFLARTDGEIHVGAPALAALA